MNVFGQSIVYFLSTFRAGGKELEAAMGKNSFLSSQGKGINIKRLSCRANEWRKYFNSIKHREIGKEDFI